MRILRLLVLALVIAAGPAARLPAQPSPAASPVAPASPSAPAGPATTAPAPAPTSVPTPALPEVLHFGYLSDRVERSFEHMAPAVEFMRGVLAPHGVKEVKVEVTASTVQMGDWLLSGQVHIFSSTPFPVLEISRRIGLEPTLHGVPSVPQQAVFVVKEGSPLKSLDALEGMTLAFTMTYSSPGYFVPAVHLRAMGYALDRPRERRALKTVFSGSALNSLYWVYFDRADVAVVARDSLDEIGGRLRESLAIIGETKPFPGFLMMVSPSLPERAREILQHWLVNFHRDPQGAKILEDYYACLRLEPLPVDVHEWIRWAMPHLPEAP